MFCTGHDQQESHFVRARETAVNPVLLGPTLPRRDADGTEYELWCRAMLVLFCPWRKPCDLRMVGESWIDAFERTEFQSDIMRVMDNICIQRECRDVRDEYNHIRRSTRRMAFLHADVDVVAERGDFE
ncbi:hypothetical protein CALVIDRAFT_489443, partial [Calocera viscosa TUFC12733]